MVFSSLGFLYLFLPAVLIVYYLMPATKNNNLRNAVLLLFSMAFYYVGEQRLVILMIISTLVDYTCGRLIGDFGEKTDIDGSKTRRVWLCRLALGISLALLAYFKYADMLIDLFNSLTGVGLPLLKIALPIGISFYTFQTMSYTIDVYRGDVRAQKNLLTFACYVTIFPQLIAGPIVRYSTVREQIGRREHTMEKFSSGVYRFLVGFTESGKGTGRIGAVGNRVFDGIHRNLGFGHGHNEIGKRSVHGALDRRLALFVFRAVDLVGRGHHQRAESRDCLRILLARLDVAAVGVCDVHNQVTDHSGHLLTVDVLAADLSDQRRGHSLGNNLRRVSAHTGKKIADELLQITDVVKTFGRHLVHHLHKRLGGGNQILEFAVIGLFIARIKIFFGV